VNILETEIMLARHYLLILFLSILSFSNVSALDEEKPGIIVQDTVNKVLDILTNENLSEIEKKNSAYEIVSSQINFTGMSRRILTTNWKKTSDEHKQEYIQVSRDQLTIDSGFWYMPSTTIVAFSGLRRISRTRSKFMVSNVIGDPLETWHFEKRNGDIQKLVLTDFFSAHSMTIAHYIRDRGYSVEWL